MSTEYAQLTDDARPRMKDLDKQNQEEREKRWAETHKQCRRSFEATLRDALAHPKEWTWYGCSPSRHALVLRIVYPAGMQSEFRQVAKELEKEYSDMTLRVTYQMKSQCRRYFVWAVPKEDSCWIGYPYCDDFGACCEYGIM